MLTAPRRSTPTSHGGAPDPATPAGPDGYLATRYLETVVGEALAGQVR